MIADVAGLRRRGIAIMTAAGWLVMLILSGMSALYGQKALWAAAISALLNLLPTLCVFQNRTDRNARLIVGTMVALQPALVLFAVQGTAWEAGVDIYFLVALAVLTVLCDIRPMIVAGCIIGGHHAILAFAAPGWVVNGEAGLMRLMVHILAVVIIGSMLCWLSLRLGEVLRCIEQMRQHNDNQSALLQGKTEKLAKALDDVEQEREARARCEIAGTEQRRRDLSVFIAEFQNSIGSVIHSFSSTVRTLEHTTKSLSSIAHEKGARALGRAKWLARRKTQPRLPERWRAVLRNCGIVEFDRQYRCQCKPTG
jgi:methyl-accepting chemotaxis protein